MSPFPSSHDDWIDLELGDVALPDGMLHRLHDIARYSDEAIDAELMSVPPPAGLLERLLKISQPRSRHWSGRQIAVAASLLIAVGLSYLGSLGFYLAAVYQHRPSALAALDSRLSGAPIESDRPTTLAVSKPVAVDRVAVDDEFVRPAPSPGIELASIPTDQPASSPALPFDLPGIDKLSPESSLLVSDRFGEQVLGAMQAEQERPELVKLPGLAPRGVKHPDGEGFNLAFLINERVHPVIELQKYRKLQQSVIPLDATAESYQLVKHYVAEEVLPSPDVVRTEEFLAAMHYDFRAPRGKLAVQIAAARSLLGNQPDLHMLQIGLQAGDVPAQPRRKPRHLIVLVDVSHSMQWGGRLENIQLALQSLVGRLGKQDRLSLVSFSQRARVLIEDAGTEHADSLRQAIAALRIESGTNMAAGLGAADRLATDWAWIGGRDQRVVLLTDGLSELDATSRKSIADWIGHPGDRRANLSVIDVSMEIAVKQPKLEFATRRPQTVNDFGWQLVEELTDQSQLIARKTQLSVRFNPNAVHSYRLLGHEETLLSDSPNADLYAGEANVGMYELQLLPKPDDEIAEVVLTYTDPNTDTRQRITSKIRRRNLSKDFASAPAPFQLGVLAAETAELLRNSPFRRGYKYATLRELAGQTSADVQSSESFQDLTALIQAADRARPGTQSPRRPLDPRP